MLKKIMGGVAAIVSLPVAVVGGVGAGLLQSMEDGSFNNFGTAFDQTGQKVVDCAKEIGEEHGPTFITAVGAIVVGGSINEQLKKKP